MALRLATAALIAIGASWIATASLAAPAISRAARSATASRPQVQVTLRPAVAAVLDAFQSHPLVAMGEYHALAQEGDFYIALVSDPRFAAEVGNVVVEFGSAAHQQTLNRYLAGEDVPYKELRRVWTDVVGFYPAVEWTKYTNFFAQVRATNAKLPPDRRIRVWLGDPDLDWSKVRTRADIAPYQAARDQFGADLVEREILAKGRKAFVIYGSGHFDPFFLRNTGVQPVDTIGAIIDKRHPGAFFRVRTYVGLPNRACSAKFETRIRDWKPGTLATPVKGTWLQDAMFSPQCIGVPNFLTPVGQPEPVLSPRMIAEMQAAVRNAPLDALLYLGPEASLTRSPAIADTYMDPEYIAELDRRSRLLSGLPFDLNSWIRTQARGSAQYDAGWPSTR